MINVDELKNFELNSQFIKDKKFWIGTIDNDIVIVDFKEQKIIHRLIKHQEAVRCIY